MAGKVHAFLVGLGVFLMVVAGVLTIQLASKANPPKRDIDAGPTSGTPSLSRAVSTTTPSASATPTAPTTTIRPSTTPPRTSAPPPTTPSTPPAHAPTWGLVWSDDFNGSDVDPSRWTTAADGVSAPDDACTTGRPENLFVSNGVLTLRALAEPDYVCAGTLRQFTTAHITTAGTASFTYGAFEVRAKAPTGNSQGLWPGFWLSPDSGAGGADVLELFGSPAGFSAATQALYAPGAQSNTYAVPGTSAGDFHVYRVEWEVGVMRWYVDGALVWSRSASTTPEFTTYFAKPYHLHLNFQVGGAPGTPEAATAFPADFQIDYVRVYQR